MTEYSEYVEEQRTAYCELADRFGMECLTEEAQALVERTLTYEQAEQEYGEYDNFVGDK